MSRLRPSRIWVVLAAVAASCAAPRPAPPIVAISPREPAQPAPSGAARDPGAVLPRLLELYDRDHDGRVSRAEYGRSAASFQNLDRDRDGSIGPADFAVPVAMPPELAAPFLVVMRFGGPEADSIAIGDLEEAFEGADENHDGALDRAEFTGPESRPGPDRFAPVLAAIDADKDGRLTLAELKSWAVQRDQDDDGRLSRRERLTRGVEPKTGWFAPADRAPAPDFTLAREDGPDTVTLSSFAGKQPVALIFGSFT